MKSGALQEVLLRKPDGSLKMRKKTSPFLTEPHGNNYVWRYMSGEKFERLLIQRGLYFCNAKRMTDKYEVTVPDSTVASWRKKLLEEGYSAIDAERKVQIRLASLQFSGIRDLTLINCWAKRTDESYALWKIYLSGSPDGVAIRTKYANLKRAIARGQDAFAEDYYGGLVQYRNHLSPEDVRSRFNIVTTKKTFYDFEGEVRLFILNSPESKGGCVPPYELSDGRTVSVDLATLLGAVFISPFSSSEFRRHLPRLLKQHGLASVQIKDSAILDKY